MTTLCDLQDRIREEMLDTMNPLNVRETVYAGVFEEAGEIAGIHKRQHRDLPLDRLKASKENLIEEIGDLLWYLTALCCVEDLNLQEVYNYNVQKLEERYGHNKSSRTL